MTHSAGENGDQYRPGARFVIHTPVATLWGEPNRNRPLDEASVAAVTDIRAWAQAMTLEQKLWLVGKLETQALYGEKAILLETRGDWAKVIVPEQPTSRDERGYPGWLPLWQLSPESEPAASLDSPTAVIRTRSAFLFDDPEGKQPFLEVSFNTKLPVAEELGSVFAVCTPADGVKYVPKASVLYICGNGPGDAAPPIGEQLVHMAKQFLGLPYLWAGLSGFGFDCSGFTYSLYRFYGIPIPRDASDQSKIGRAVDKDGLRAGDLLFFAHQDGSGSIHHVGMYAGDGEMIHAPNSARSIERISLEADPYKHEYAGARRYLPETR
ncbi:C40 family peptidase [Paenibacillus ginsengarvi]|uniref:NlpC/P60 family protein n=1 Tax=Paenibacillus ginsengarvi TaxID=400777 RepID=A0A3B0CIL3_9BACL|nr:C40 family peptidase [Paenibacillus ginsengarvi]RKN84147.1 NlpC/P60 family protein [Paenibacillus ginsengarvi]